ncbi:hypothetical protein PP175_29275 (plasmid) [Aneurinibacillus sp. Ricciae_BoGa-3]|uniref:hypothetical protein n=1 Tax=Aneurinibacillus sp. Ricciae_BoGa-3 TaxID=3022697 RepID=UPI00233F916F|nr:hypothetical protein [Aneurinibacillus sp. Ricciae_BoGa-3]WCK57284.1 hypothetical protein PP175_29275 [Aneurinibacillus sp. Ricciae_BoGa-3]
MEGIKKIQISKLVAEGFKGFKERTELIFDAGKNTFIGDNGKGKSSIGDLIVWIITGKNIQGKQKDLNIINKDSDTAIGTLSFADENGESHEIERKMNGTTTIKFDGKRISQKQLEEQIPMEMFLLIFSPFYFLSMDAENSRKTIYSLLPGVKKEEVLKQLDAAERAFLEKETFDIQTTNEYLKNRRKELTDIEDKKKYLNGYMAKLQEQIVIPDELKFDDNKIIELEKQLEEVNSRKPVLKNLSDLLLKKSEFDKKIAEIRGERFESEKIKLELQKEKAVLEQKLAVVQAKEYKPADTAKLDTKLAVLRNDYKSVFGQQKELEQQIHALDSKQIHFHEGDQCPSCKQIITAQTVSVLNGELQKQVKEEKTVMLAKQAGRQKTLAELAEEGKALAEEITKAKEEDERNRKAFEEAKAKEVTSIQEALKEVVTKLTNLATLEEKFANEKQAKLKQVMAQVDALQIDKLEKENAQIQKSFDEQVGKLKASLQQSLSELRKEKETAIKIEARRTSLLKRVEDNKKELDMKKVELEGFEKQEAHINAQISHMKIFNAQKTAIVNSALSKYLTSISLKLEKSIQSTGEVKECFDILYEGKELKVCSTSENIKAGLEISHMISQLSSLDYPVFVDNGESITSYEEKASQTIETMVVKGKKLSFIKNGKETEIVPKPKTRSKRASVVDEAAL